MLDTHSLQSLQELSARFLSCPEPCCLAIVGSIYLGLRFWGKSWICIFKTLRFCHFLPWFYPELFRNEPKTTERAGGSQSWSSSSSLLTGRWDKGRRDRMRGREEGQVYFWRLRKKPQGNWPRWALGWMRDRRGFSWCNWKWNTKAAQLGVVCFTSSAS